MSVRPRTTIAVVELDRVVVVFADERDRLGRARRAGRRTSPPAAAPARRARCRRCRRGSRGSSRSATTCSPGRRTRPRRSPGCRGPPRRRRPRRRGPPDRRRRSRGRTSREARRARRGRASPPATRSSGCAARRRCRARRVSRAGAISSARSDARPPRPPRGRSIGTERGCGRGTRAAGGCRGEKREPTIRYAGPEPRSGSSAAAMNARRKMSLSSSSPATSARRRSAGISITSPASRTTAVRYGRAPVSRLSSPRKRWGPCTAMTRFSSP